MSHINPPLNINARVIDIASDTEEGLKTFNLRKVDVDLRQFRSYSAAKANHDEQQEALDKKIKRIIDLLIWAMNNHKEVIFVNALDDKD